MLLSVEMGASQKTSKYEETSEHIHDGSKPSQFPAKEPETKRLVKTFKTLDINYPISKEKILFFTYN